MLSWIERITERIAEQIEAEHCRSDRDSRENGGPGGASKLVEIAAVCNHGPPARSWRWNSEAQKRQRSLSHDCAGDAKRRSNDDRRNHVRKNVLQHDAEITRTERANRLDVFELSHDEHLSANETGHSRPSDDSNRRVHDAHRRLERGDHRDQQQQGWKRERDIRQSHYELIHPSPVEAGEQTKRYAKKQRNSLRDEADSERDPRAINQSRPDIAALNVGAEEMVGGWFFEQVDEIDLDWTLPGNDRREDRSESHDDDDDDPDSRAVVAQKSCSLSGIEHHLSPVGLITQTDLAVRVEYQAAVASIDGAARNTAPVRHVPTSPAAACISPRSHRHPCPCRRCRQSQRARKPFETARWACVSQRQR